MRHGIKTKKLNRTSSHRKAMFANLAVALLQHEQIKTTLPKAKVLRPYVEKLITTAKKPSLAVTRKLIATLGDEVVVKKLLADIAPRMLARPGGYTRIFKMGFRHGDMAPMAVIELVDKQDVVKAAAEPKAVKTVKPKKEAKTTGAPKQDVIKSSKTSSAPKRAAMTVKKKVAVKKGVA